MNEGLNIGDNESESIIEEAIQSNTISPVRLVRKFLSGAGVVESVTTIQEAVDILNESVQDSENTGRHSKKITNAYRALALLQYLQKLQSDETTPISAKEWKNIIGTKAIELFGTVPHSVKAALTELATEASPRYQVLNAHCASDKYSEQTEVIDNILTDVEAKLVRWFGEIEDKE